MTTATEHPRTRLTGVAGGVWQEGRTARAQCACCGGWIVNSTAWRYWVRLVAVYTVCNHCATGGDR